MSERLSRAHRALARVCEVYRLGLQEQADGREILSALGLASAGFADAHQIGYAPGTLASILPESYATVRALEAAGVLDGGREPLGGCVVVPVFDAQRRVEILVGLTPEGVGPRAGCAAGGLWNWAALKVHTDVSVTTDLVAALRRVHDGDRAVVAVVGEPTAGVRDHFTLWKPARLLAADPAAAAILERWGLAAQAAAQTAAGGLTVDLAARRYILSEITRQGRRLGVLIRAIPRGGPAGRQYLDVANLYAARDRARLVRELVVLFGVEAAQIEDDLVKLVAAAEEYGRAPRHEVRMTEQERDEAMALLSDPKLPDRIVADFERLGLVGERTNKLLGYLVAVSRRLAEPLSLLFLSRSAAGKSTLAEAIAALVPPEDLVRLTRLTGQALFYKAGLRHKLLIVEEESGAAEAGYALRVLQSARRLAVATASGTTEVEGPVAVIVTGTRASLDEETRSRFMVATADESAEQTAAILEAQRRAETLDGRAERAAREAIAALHHNAQRLLRPLGVVNPLAPALAFESRRLSARREQPRLLALMRTVAFLRQYQKRVVGGEYVEVDEADVGIARGLSAEGEELSPPAQRLLAEIGRIGSAVTRRGLRERLGWGNTQLWVALRELVEFEYLGARREGRMGRLVYHTLSEPGPKPSNGAEGAQE